METTQRILLNGAVNKQSVNENETLNINLSGNMKLLPEDAINDTLDSYELYLDERAKSNKFRIIINVNPYCTNVLFNPFTEIVRYEGSSGATCLNYSATTVENVIGKDSGFTWTQYDAVRDTQLSNNLHNYEYHCGIDIFNNHILRSKTFKAVNYDSINSRRDLSNLGQVFGNNYSNVSVIYSNKNHIYDGRNDNATGYDFNTIDDYMRDRDGVIISEVFPKIVNKGDAEKNLEGIILPLHLYQDYDILSFEECVDEKLGEENGWYGFRNPSTMDSLSISSGENDVYLEELLINKTINNREYCDFIDMYPGRDLYSFNPKYNNYRHRVEKNWNYCITYPSSSVIRNGDDKDFPFFNIDESGKTSLRAYMIDEGTVDDDGIKVLTVYSVCQHGLMVDDDVNIYKTYKAEVDGEMTDITELFYDNVKVKNVIDKYTFQVAKDDANMSNFWLEVDNRYLEKTVPNPAVFSGDSSIEYVISEVYGENPIQRVLFGLYEISGVTKSGKTNVGFYPICESNRVNIDPTAQNIHFKRVVNEVECEYYVRIFSRLPNFKFKDEEVNDYTLYDEDFVNNKKKNRNGSNDLTLIQRFSKPGNENSPNRKEWPVEFESHVGKLSFSNTSYGDDAAEIVFTDDIDTSYLRDNLGRPLSDVFLTFVKNNRGYKEWYGIDAIANTKAFNIEYSHCFGKVNSSFLLSDYYRELYLSTNTDRNLFYDVRDITSSSSDHDLILSGTDEVNFDEDWNYYGDICCYSPVDCDEQIIQTAMHRFNTVQREMSVIEASVKDEFKIMYHDEIRDVENNLLYNRIVIPQLDVYEKFSLGSRDRKKASEISVNDSQHFYHTTREEYSGMTKFKEGYYYQPHYRIPVKTVSQALSTDNGIKFEIAEIKTRDDDTFEFKTLIANDFAKNDKLVLYKSSTNEYYFITVRDLITTYRFTCVINNEFG